MMKETAVNHKENSAFMCLDDKSIVPIGEPGKPVLTGVRAHNKLLVASGSALTALDHDFHVHGAVASVMFNVNIPDNSSDSFYDGQEHVTLKDKVFCPSTPLRHATEHISIRRQNNSEDGLSLTTPVFFVDTDGGPDHMTNYWSVQLSYIAMFPFHQFIITLDMDMLITLCTASAQCYNNPAERCMSILNLGVGTGSLEPDRTGSLI